MAATRRTASIFGMSGENTIEQAQVAGRVLLNEPDGSVRDALTLLLRGEGWTVVHIANCEDLAAAMETGDVTAVISEASLPDCTPGKILEHCKNVGVPLVFTGHDLSLQGAVDLIRQGALDFLDKPFPQSRLLDLLDGLKRRQNR